MTEPLLSKEIINCGSIERESIPSLSIDGLSRISGISAKWTAGLSLIRYPSLEGEGVEIIALLADDPRADSGSVEPIQDKRFRR